MFVCFISAFVGFAERVEDEVDSVGGGGGGGGGEGEGREVMESSEHLADAQERFS